jgi:hypothetical protein
VWIVISGILIFQIIALVSIAIIIKRSISSFVLAKQAEIEAKIHDTLYDFVAPQGDGKASKLGDLLANAGLIVGQAAANTIMSNLNASNGHAVRAANDIAGAIDGQSSPLAGVLGLLKGGRRGKGAAIGRLAEILGPMLGGGSAAGGNGSAEYIGRKHRE